MLCFTKPPKLALASIVVFISLSSATYGSGVRRQTSCLYEGSQGVNYSQTMLLWKSLSHFSCPVEIASQDVGRFPGQLAFDGSLKDGQSRYILVFWKSQTILQELLVQEIQNIFATNIFLLNF